MINLKSTDQVPVLPPVHRIQPLECTACDETQLLQRPYQRGTAPSSLTQAFEVGFDFLASHQPVHCFRTPNSDVLALDIPQRAGICLYMSYVLP